MTTVTESQGSVVSPGTAASAVSEVPLVLDMDGTLLATNTLAEGIAQLLRRQPLHGLAIPWWLLRGRSGFKRAIADRVRLAPELLPYQEALVEYLRAAYAAGRRVVLFTATDPRFAAAVAEYVGVFDGVIAPSSGDSFTASTKARLLVEKYGTGGFDFVGSDLADLDAMAAARTAVAVDPTPALQRRLSRVENLEQTLPGRRQPRFTAMPRALRTHQWIKNLLVYLPVLATMTAGYVVLVPATIAFAAFCLVASSVYVLNDLLDLDSDRRHPRKRLRPFAVGALPIEDGLAMIPVLMLGGLLLATWLPPLFMGVLLLYWFSSTLYSVWLKRVPLLDTLLLAGLYTLRVIGGAVAIGVAPSAWLLAFSMFFFLSLALAKRHSELVEQGLPASEDAILGRQYRPEDLATLMSQGSAAGYAAVLVLALYIDGAGIREHYNHPEIIWLICPLLLYWINKLWLNSQRREVEEDPIVWAISNRVSRGIAVLCVVLLLLARWLPPYS